MHDNSNGKKCIFAVVFPLLGAPAPKIVIHLFVTAGWLDKGCPAFFTAVRFFLGFPKNSEKTEKKEQKFEKNFVTN
jgi:hypothetical protein